MKNKNIILSLTLLVSLSACGNNSSTPSVSSSNQITSSSSSSSSKVEYITGVEIVGPTSVLVNKRIRLTADVIGSDDDSVTWESSDSSIASVESDGSVLGLKEGQVEIKATSVKDPSYYGLYTVSITLPKANQINVFIDEGDVSYDKTKDVYTAFLGQTFYIDTSFTPIDSKQPDITYSVTYPSGTEENSVSVEIIPDTTRAKIISYGVYEGLIITATGKYNDLATADLKSSIEVNILDKNADIYNEALNLINSLDETNKVSSTFNRTITTITDDVETKKVEDYTHKSFTNASYVDKNVKTYTNNQLDNEEVTHYYQGVNTLNGNNNFYTFSYDDEQNITNIYDSSKYTNGVIDASNISLFFDVQGNITYGYLGMIKNIVSGSSNIYDGSIASFANTYVYAYSNIQITHTEGSSSDIKITSECLDEDYDISYALDLHVTFTGNKFERYSFTEIIDNGTTKTIFKEEIVDYKEGTLLEDTTSNNDSFINLNQYYLEDYEIIQFNEKDPNGAYDYTNENKYGAIQGLENGLVKYYTTYDKTIVLKVNALSPTTANVNFDNVKVQSSDNSQVPSVSSIADGIFTINAAKNDAGKSLTGKAIFTFTSTKGVTKQVVIEFTKTILKDVNVTFGSKAPKYIESENLYEFDPIFEGDNSDYFFINTTPDEDIYEFNLDVIEGDASGIELFRYEKNNIQGNPEFSFSIKGIKKGTYKFKIQVKGFELIKDDKTFKITVDEPYSIEYIKEKIINESYEFKGSISTYKFTFVDETTLSYIEEYGYGGSSSTTFKYHIEEGAIVIDETQNFLSGMYFSRLSKGKVLFTRDFKVLNFYIEIYDENRLESQSAFTYNINFNKVNKPVAVEDVVDYINGKTLIDSESVIEVSFNNGKGTLNFYDYSGLIATFTFDYAYNSKSKQIVFSNSTSSNETYTLIDKKCEFDTYNQELVFRINNNQYDFYDNYKVSIHA